jgi:hypothetical protein
MKSMCCLCIKLTHENTSERTILHLVKKFVWLLALQKRLATPLVMIAYICLGHIICTFEESAKIKFAFSKPLKLLKKFS